MKVTRVTPVSITPRERGVCGVFTIVLDGVLCIHRVLVINGVKGLFVSFPSTRVDDDDSKRYLDLVHPLNNTLRDHINSEVLALYRDELKTNKYE